MLRWIVISVLFFILGFLANECTIGHKQEDHIKNLNSSLIKQRMFYGELVNWVKLKQKKHSISDYLASMGYSVVAIYGMKELGELLLDELRESNIDVLYAIDQNAENVYPPIEVYTPSEELAEVDVIIVTVQSSYEIIHDALSRKVNCDIISIDDVLKGCISADDNNRYNNAQ